MFPDAHPSPNIQRAPDVYEVFNRSFDQDGRVWRALRAVHPWDDAVVVDLGAGTGFHLPAFASAAKQVIGVEPHAPSRLRAMARLADAGVAASVMAGSAEHTGLATDSVDLIVARWAYFWGPGCEAGIAECDRVLRPGGTLAVLDNDLRTGTWADFLQRAEYTNGNRVPDTVERFWAEAGFTAHRIATSLRFADEATRTAVLRNEFPEGVADMFAEEVGPELDYHVILYTRRRP